MRTRGGTEGTTSASRALANMADIPANCVFYWECRLILTYLIVASLPLGYFPSEELLAEFDLSDQYEVMLPALRVSDIVPVGSLLLYIC